MGAPQDGRLASLLWDSEVAESLFQRFEIVLPEPFLSAVRNVPFFSAGLTDGFSVFTFFFAGALLPVVVLSGAVSDPLADEELLIGFLDAFSFDLFSLETGFVEME